MRVLADISPALSIDFNFNFLKAISKTSNLPNFNTPFYPVNGIAKNSVKRFIEADDRGEDDPVILYLHGGAYIYGLLPNELALLMDVWKQFNTESDRLSVLAVDYSIVNQATWPAPLQETAAVYNELTKTSKNIIVFGDSAGGHLALSLLRHIKYPVNSVPAVTVKPQGLVVLSPEVNIYPDHGNGTKNGTFET